MEKFVRLKGLVAPLDRPNVDTDAIIPKQFLKSIKRTGFGVNLFDAWRYLDAGEPGMDNAKRPATAAAAAIAGLSRWVRPPAPWRPSKLRFEVEAHRSPG